MTMKSCLRTSSLLGRNTISYRHYSLAEAFEIISKNRHAERDFSSADVDAAVLHKVLELTQLAPSSFNIQPYKVIVVQSAAMKDLVSTAMNPGNDRHVKTAGCTFIFAADKDPARFTRKLMDLETANGAKPSYVSSLPAKITLLLGKGAVSNRIRALGSHLLSPLSPSPIIRPTNEVWGVKNAAFAAQQLMLAATAYGLRTLPMEGFDERRLSAILDISLDDYAIPVVICMGHAAKEGDTLPHLANGRGGGSNRDDASQDCGRAHPAKIRFPLEDMFYSEKFGSKLNTHNAKSGDDVARNS